MSDAAMHEASRLDRHVESVDAQMLNLLDACSGNVAAAARELVSAGGKRLRPLLVLAARPSTACDQENSAGSAWDRAATRAGAAVELVHTASLVHDDLLDSALMRRGTPTVGVVAGRETAVAAGDLLFSLAFTSIAQVRHDVGDDRALAGVHLLAEAARTLAVGEALQARQLRDVSLDERAYLDRCAAKTGALFSASLRLGAMLGGADPADVYRLGSFGSLVGTAFQMADDVLDCGAPEVEAVLGKRPGADLRDGTMTLPLITAAHRDSDLRERLAQVVTEIEIEPLLARVRATGAVEHARARALALHDDAVELLDELHGRFHVANLRRVARASVERVS